jgi:hypothetical protein
VSDLHGPDGRFTKGNPGGPGRPPKPREEKYTEVLRTAVTFEQFERIVKKLAQKAEKGDMLAIRLLTELLTIPIAKRIEVTGANGGPLAIAAIDILLPDKPDADA